MFRNLKIWQKLLAAGIFACLPVVVLTILFLRSQEERIVRTRQEVSGMAYLPPLRHLLESLPKHRAAASAFLSGESSMRAQMLNLQGQVEAAIKEADLIDQQIGRLSGAGASWDQIRARWSDLKEKTLNLSASESFERHTQLIAAINKHLRLVGDATMLTTEPDLDAFYLAGNLLRDIPDAAESLSQLASLGSSAAVQHRLNPGDEVRIRYLVRQVSAAIEQMQQNFNTAFRYNPALREKLEADLHMAMQAGGYLRNVAQREILEGGAVMVNAEAYLAAGEKAVSSLWKSHDRTATEVTTLLEARIRKLNSEKLVQMVIGTLLLFLSLMLVFVIQRSITSQVKTMRETFEQIRDGNYEARAEVLSQDELGMMAATTNDMLSRTLSLIQSQDERNRIQESILKLLEEVQGVAEGDLSKEAEVTAELTGAIADSFNVMIVELRRIIGAVQDTTSEVNRVARTVQQSAEQLATGSQRQSVEIRQASRALEEMAEAIRNVAANANEAAAVAQNALKNALDGGESVRRTVEGMQSIRAHVQDTARRMKRLGESSQEIGEIVQLISDISDRTSIVAMNASIQASMAGESGKGFALVADEVERLAERATESTKRIATLIKSVQTDTNAAISSMEATTREVVSGSQVATEAGTRLQNIEEVSRQISEVVSSISEIAQEEAAASEEVARTFTGVSLHTDMTATGTREAAAQIRRLAMLALELNESMSHFRLPDRNRNGSTDTPALARQ